METHLNLNFHHHAEAIHQAAKRQLLLTLAAALALGALMLLPALAKAGDADPMIGANAPHQERSGGAALGSTAVTVTATTPPTNPAQTVGRRAFVAANTVVVVTAQAPATNTPPRGSDLPFEALVGSNAPRQERNPSQHPELWSSR